MLNGSHRSNFATRVATAKNAFSVNIAEMPTGIFLYRISGPVKAETKQQINGQMTAYARFLGSEIVEAQVPAV